ncbi:FHA domain-containing protein [Parashewanella spongiae]|uniref:FHA domain-containing protein n=1 Tax=Parashewanella spongiae TaxID=342950 RepID=A0A3A6TTX1_9GAMM|nr:FHA domain-containing protein [Parashewanella spongiae]MCL1078171.1 FHA domain-containing protein [Parashewanella spongiae]RJY14893.1 FHA domain-containing protein [Parashewanella spongiae]
MSLSIRIICSPDGESISEWTTAFPENGGEIGRGYGSVMQLNDATRTISSTHAIIRKSNRGYQILDNSTNGLFINGSDKPLGKGNQSTVNDGDVLSIGKYRLLVSCFSPESARSQKLQQPSEYSELDDDPFSSDENTIIDDSMKAQTTLKQRQSQQHSDVNFTITTDNVVEDDPFLNDTEIKEKQHSSFSTNFDSVDDDPFKEEDLKGSLSFPMREPQTAPAPVQSLSQFDMNFAINQLRHIEEQMKAQTDTAIEMAITRLLKEMSPEYIESMFNDISSPSMFSGKPKYWEMYKRYFERQQKNRDWQVKFHAYFQDSLRQQRNAGEKT